MQREIRFVEPLIVAFLVVRGIESVEIEISTCNNDLSRLSYPMSVSMSNNGTVTV